MNVALGLGVADLCSRYGKLQFAFVPSTLAQSTFPFLAQAFLAQREILLMVIPFGRFKTFNMWKQSKIFPVVRATLFMMRWFRIAACTNSCVGLNVVYWLSGVGSAQAANTFIFVQMWCTGCRELVPHKRQTHWTELK